MAEIKSGVLGKFRGSVGNITGRIRNGKNYMSLKPESYNIPNDPAAVARRAKFALVAKFSAAVLKNPGLKSLWKIYVENPGLIFQDVVSLNYKMISNGDLSQSNIITPFNGFAGVFSNLVLSSSQFTADVGPLNGLSDFDLGVETQIKIAAVVYLSNPVSENSEAYDFISIESEGLALQLDNPSSFNIVLNSYEGSRIAAFNDKQIFLAAYTVDNENNPVNFSVTFVQ